MKIFYHDDDGFDNQWCEEIRTVKESLEYDRCRELAISALAGTSADDLPEVVEELAAIIYKKRMPRETNP